MYSGAKGSTYRAKSATLWQSMSNKITYDPARLKSRLSQPRMTRVEALKQFQATIPLSPSARKELDEYERVSRGGKNEEASRIDRCGNAAAR
jgi:hypothetical protein